MAQQAIPVLKEKFSDGKTPTGADFGDIFDSYIHKSTKINQTQILGLADDLADKASKTDLANVVSGLNPMGDAQNLQDLETKPKRNNDAYFVLDQLDENGDPYIFRYDAELELWINTKQVVYRNVAKKEDLEKLEADLEAAKGFSFVSNEEYIFAIVDSEDRFLFGIKWDGSIPVSSESAKPLVGRFKVIEDKIKELIRKGDFQKIINADFTNQLALLEKAINEIGVDSDFSIITNDEYIFAIVDSAGRFLFGVKWDGSIPISSESVKGLSDRLSLIERHIKKNRTDFEKEKQRIREYIDSLRLHSDYSNESAFTLPFPRKLARIEFVGVDWTKLVIKGDVIPCYMAYIDYNGSYFFKKVLLEFQGSSSSAYPKKNFTVEILNEDDSSARIRVGSEWPVLSKFVLKANFIDFTQARNVGMARLAYQTSLEQPYGQRFAWEPPYDANESDLARRFPTGARGVIDGFPCEVYINDEYRGNYTWNIGKIRDNFAMDKNNPLHILMSAETHCDFTQFIASQWDFKNGSMSNQTTSGAVLRLFDWMNKVNAGEVDFLTTYEDYWTKYSWLRYFIFSTLFWAPDTVFKNGLVYSMDGKHWGFELYDLDTIMGLDWMGASYYPDSLTTLYSDVNTPNLMPWKPVIQYWMNDVKALYSRLRKTVLSEENVTKTFKEITDIFGVESYKKDAERWPMITSNGNPDIWWDSGEQGCYTSISQLADWYQRRVAFVDTLWLIP